jgi:hypothetical protein
MATNTLENITSESASAVAPAKEEAPAVEQSQPSSEEVAPVQQVAAAAEEEKPVTVSANGAEQETSWLNQVITK